MKNTFLIIIAVFLNFCTNKNEIEEYPKSIDYENIKIEGELKERADANFERLHKGRYLPDSIYLIPNPEYHQSRWPGDLPGRLVLGITLLEQATGKKSPNIEEILADFPKQMNENGYFGMNYGDMLNEQQLSSHGWVLRGLAEHYIHTGDQQTYQLLQQVADSLVLPTLGYHSSYPIDPSKREDAGEFMGSHSKAIGKWILSTDVGCDFIFMDGVIHAYEILQTPELEKISNEMINRFLEADLIAIKAQTHATLTALRAILRFYGITKQDGLVEAVEKRFDIYKTEGMTENWENYNWFGRPRWTEPCAVIDSYIVANELWKYTKKPKYLQDAQLIYYNGISVGQRWNGGFGCNSCLGNQDPYKTGNTEMFVSISTNESHWCCTMRGGEGFASAVKYALFTQGDTVFIPDFRSFIAEMPVGRGKMELQAHSNYPFEEGIKYAIQKINGINNPVFKIFIPNWIQNLNVSINGKPYAYKLDDNFLVIQEKIKSNDEINILFDQKYQVKSNQNIHTIEGYHSFWYGPLLLGLNTQNEINLSDTTRLFKTGQRTFMAEGTNIELTTINHLMSSDLKKENNYNFQALFQNN